MLDLTQEQKHIINELWKWFAKKQTDFITLGGYAGTGKTTLISVLRKEVHKRNDKVKVAFVAYTGKASRVLAKKITEQKAKFKNDFVGTIHSLIYAPIVNSKDEIIGWDLKEPSEVKYDLIIIDEASMVDSNIWKDITSFEIPIIAVGDHGQLPPISGNFNLIEEPVLRLEEIHRQAKNNPIINLSIMAREQGYIPPIELSRTVKKIDKTNEESGNEIDELLRSYNDETLILTGYNHTRVKLNQFIRSEVLELYTQEPTVGDTVICLRNNHEKEIFNGMIGAISSLEDADEDHYFATVVAEDTTFSGLILKEQFGANSAINFTNKRSRTLKADLFDFGYALTVHKAQGSQSKRVIVFEERFSKMSDEDYKRWLYTAVTRAEEELYIIG